MFENYKKILTKKKLKAISKYMEKVTSRWYMVGKTEEKKIWNDKD